MYAPTTNDISVYDFSAEDNAQKWRGLFVDALQKVQRQVHLSLSAKSDALTYIEHLILQLLSMLCASHPHTVQEVEDRVQKTFPHPIDKWAIGDAQNALDKGKKKCPLELPVDKIHPLLREVLGYKVDLQVSTYIVAVLEYIAADIFKLTGNYVKNIKHQEITCQDIKVAMCADKVLMDMFFQDDELALGVEEETIYVRRGSLTYEEIVKDLILEETQYMRDLNMIINVFMEPFTRLFPRSKDLDVIFSNILEVHEFTANLLSSLEDTVEVTEKNEVPLVGACFEELVEAAEFDVYEKFADEILMPHGRERLNTLLQRSDASRTLQSKGRGFKEAVKYVLPKLLLGPIYHCLRYFDVIKALIDTSTDDEDKECLEQVNGCLRHLKLEIEKKLGSSMIKRKPGEMSLRFQGRAGRQAALSKMNELQKSIDGWEGKDIGQSCNEFIMEGVLFKNTGKNRATERYVFLFDALIILTKHTKRTSVTGPVGDYKLKDKFSMRKLDVVDRDDAEDLKNAFELQVRDQAPMLLSCKTAEEKNNWMAALVSLLTRSMLERMLDGKLSEEEKKTPLVIPCPEQYRFAEEDSQNNIVFEGDENGLGTDTPLIKGGTLLKLVERLTYHMYADPKFVRTFLTTYRSFCKPKELLELLVERFRIPDPPNCDNKALKRFRKEYCKPIQFRVLNVLRHWVDQHWYDFEWDQELLYKLNEFMDTVKGKAMRKWVESINKVISRKKVSQLESPVEKQYTYNKQQPPIEWHIVRNLEDFDLLTLHPIEIARQVTLLEFDLYRAVKPCEMVGSVWIKEQKHTTSPNLLKMIHHSTTFTYWLEKCIVESQNIEERTAMVSRIIEIMVVFQELNNFSGILEVVSALNSAPVHRLEHTFMELPHKLVKALEEAQELNSDHYRRYIEKLRSINPPCVPFLGMYLTNIFLTEEGNPDFLPNRPEGIINFSKRRKVAEITGEIQQYQNQPYCLSVESIIRSFFENLAPLEGWTEKDFNDYLYEKSLDIEPRNSRVPPKADRKLEYSLKSPGIKPMASRHSTTTLRASQPSSLTSATNSPSAIRVSEDGEKDNNDPPSPSIAETPTTPSTPLTPPPQGSSEDRSSIFSVNFPETSLQPQHHHLASLPTTPSPPFQHPLPPNHPRHPQYPQPTSAPNSQTSALGDSPPPLPPRRGTMRALSTLDCPPVRQDDGSDRAPPLPPRLTPMSMTLPRAMSSPSHHNTTPHTHRRNSENSSETHFNFNGGAAMPELPPKTYKTHSRKPSS